LILSERMQGKYPHLICDLAEEFFTVHNPDPKPGATRLLFKGVKAQKLRWRDIVRDGIESLRVFR
jgi:electron transfer flavoprotein-quinone oxidoreductase